LEDDPSQKRRLIMYLKHVPTGALIEVLNLSNIVNPFLFAVRGKSQADEDAADIDFFNKTDLVLPSGEPLPLCWIDRHY
jgi:hypothetical protein